MARSLRRWWKKAGGKGVGIVTVAVILSRSFTPALHDPVPVFVNPNAQTFRWPINDVTRYVVVVTLSTFVVVIMVIMDSIVANHFTIVIFGPSAGRVIAYDGHDVVLKGTDDMLRLMLVWRWILRPANLVRRQGRIVAHVGVIVEASSLLSWFVVVLVWRVMC